jgi:predicted AAA+ superfamily ATPase
LRRGYTVYVGKTPTSEIDFVTRDSRGSFAYYQVCYTLQEHNALERELALLLGVDDHYPKYLITLDEENESDYKGIRIINTLDFLLS